MVDECYAEDCEVVNMMTGYTMHGREELRAIEHAMLQFDGTRRMEITNMSRAGTSLQCKPTRCGARCAARRVCS